MRLGEIDLTIGNRSYHTNGDTLDLMIITRLPASKMELRKKLVSAWLYPHVGSDPLDDLSLSECLIVMAAHYDEGITIP